VGLKPTSPAAHQVALEVNELLHLFHWCLLLTVKWPSLGSWGLPRLGTGLPVHGAQFTAYHLTETVSGGKRLGCNILRTLHFCFLELVLF
jgi:hypothetical protein